MMVGDARPYFPYIDGLRAVSIIAVVLFHLDPRLLPAGFGGVDIFFVVSGFIVSGSLHGYKAPSFLALVGLFYARRFRRIVPALVLMLVTTTIAVTIFVPPSWIGDNIKRTAIPAFFGLSNFRLAKGDDYFSPQAEFNPFTHTWSLGVEEQFYVVFPFLIFLLMRGGRTMHASMVGLLALCMLSFAFGFIEPSLFSGSTFYSSLSRFWEIGAGVLLYAALARYGLFEARPMPLPEISIATYLGALLIACGLVVGSPQTYPVPGAILPVAGALLVIFGLQGREPMSPVGKLLSSRVAVAIGLISYSLYLWHWPVFTMFRWTAGFSTPAQKLVALAIAVALALVSYFFVETPLRISPWLRPPRRAIPAGLLAVMLLGWGADRLFAHTKHLSATRVVAEQADWFPGFETRNDTGCRVRWRPRSLERGYVTETERLNCDGADATAKIFVVGDSHALSYFTLLADYTKATRRPAASYHVPGCQFVHLIPSVSRCEGVFDAVLNDIRQQVKAGDVIFMTSLRVPRFRSQWDVDRTDVAGAWRQVVATSDLGFDQALAVIEKLNVPGVHFVFELPKPIFPTPLFRCSDWFNHSNPSCRDGTELDRAYLLQYRQPVLDFAEKLKRRVRGFTTWDPFPVLCPDMTCSMWKDGKPLFYDGDHLSAYANRLLLADFTQKIAQLGATARESTLR